MNRTVSGTLATLAIAAYGLLANPAAAQSQDVAPVGCTGDYVCGDPASVVPTWPMERWDQVRRAPRKLTSSTDAAARKDGKTSR
jgi:hypothetical protein